MGDILAIGAADDLHMAGDHKSRVEAHAKLADDVDIRTCCSAFSVLNSSEPE